MLCAFAVEAVLEDYLVFKSKRPIYAIILLTLSSLWLCAIVLPLLYFVLFPNDGIQGVVLALEGRGTEPPESETLVQQTIATVGLLRTAIPIAYSTGATATFHTDGSHTSRKMRQASYIAWFQKPPRPMLVAITQYESDGGGEAYWISEGDFVGMVRGYTLPLLLFGVSLFLARIRKSPVSPA